MKTQEAKIKELQTRIGKSGISVAELARKAGLGYHTVRGLQQGIAKGLTLRTIDKIEPVLTELGV